MTELTVPSAVTERAPSQVDPNPRGEAMTETQPAVMNPANAARLREPFPDSAIGTLPRGGRSLSFVGHAAVTDRLLEIDPTWSWEPVALDDDGLPRLRENGKEIELWIRLTVCGHTRLGVGTAPADSFELAKQLISDALRNAAMRFGVALDLWSREDLATPATAAPAPEPETLWWDTAGWDSQDEHDRWRTDLMERGKALGPAGGSRLREWLGLQAADDHGTPLYDGEARRIAARVALPVAEKWLEQLTELEALAEAEDAAA